MPDDKQSKLSEPPLSGRWHHGNGVLVSGSIRIAQWACDTNPPAEFRERMLDWVCETLNRAVNDYEQQTFNVAETPKQEHDAGDVSLGVTGAPQSADSVLLGVALEALRKLSEPAHVASPQTSALAALQFIETQRASVRPVPRHAAVPWPRKEDVTEDMRAGFERLYQGSQGKLNRTPQGTYRSLRTEADWVFYQRAWADAVLAAQSAPQPAARAAIDAARTQQEER